MSLQYGMVCCKHPAPRQNRPNLCVVYQSRSATTGAVVLDTHNLYTDRLVDAVGRPHLPSGVPSDRHRASTLSCEERSSVSMGAAASAGQPAGTSSPFSSPMKASRDYATKAVTLVPTVDGHLQSAIDATGRPIVPYRGTPVLRQAAAAAVYHHSGDPRPIVISHTIRTPPSPSPLADASTPGRASSSTISTPVHRSTSSAPRSSILLYASNIHPAYSPAAYSGSPPVVVERAPQCLTTSLAHTEPSIRDSSAQRRYI